MQRGTPRIVIRCAPEWRTQLEAIAQREGLTLSGVIRAAILAYIVEHTNQEEK